MIGLPASGKSTYIMKHTTGNIDVLSSDAIRKELLWSDELQHSNGEVFRVLFNRLNKLQSEKVEEIYIDATSISLTDRRKALNAIKRWNKAKMVSRIGNEVELERFYKVKAIVFTENVHNLIQRDLNRKRTVWETVIMRMLTRFIPPTLEEGFDEIEYVSPEPYTHKNKEVFFKVMKSFLIGESNIEEVLASDEYLSKSLNCEQTSQWHQETLLEHLCMILDVINKEAKQEDMKLLKLLTLFHDIWKPFVRCKKKYHLIRRWYEQIEGSTFKKKNGTLVEIENYDDYQFLEHESFSANIFVSDYAQLLIDNNIITQDESDLLEIIIRGHLIFHQNNGKSSIILGWIKYESDSEIFRLWTLFSYCDEKGRIWINDIKNNNE